MTEAHTERPTKTKLTKSAIDSLPLATDGKQYAVMDTELRGFGIRVGSTSKTFIVFKRLPHGAPKRVSLGKYGSLTVDAARKSAQEQLSALVHGVDVNAEKKAVKLQQKKDDVATEQTFGRLLDTYKNEHLVAKKGGKQGTLRSYEDTLNFFRARKLMLLTKDVAASKKENKDVWKEDEEIFLEDWLSRPFRSITSKEVLERHDYYDRGRPTRLIGGVLKPMQRTHQIAFKFAQAAFNFTLPRDQFEEGGDLLPNPFDVLKIYKRWKEVNVRTRFIDFTKKDEMGLWLNAINKYSEINPVAADFMLYSLLQAGRSIEIWGMKWADVDLEHENVTYGDTKNHSDYTFPLTKMAVEILKRRKEENIPKNSPWVWAYPASETGHIPADSTHHFHELEQFGAKYVSSHDLKRTWASAANMLHDKERDINFLLKHAERDVNRHYFMKFRGVALSILQSVEDMFVGKYQQFMDLPTVVKAEQ